MGNWTRNFDLERKRRSPAALVCCLAQLGFWAPSVSCGGGGASIVYDPINHVENAAAAVEAIKQTAGQIQAYALQAQQYAAQLQNLKRLPDEILQRALKPYQDEAKAATQLYSELKSAYRDVKSLQSGFQSRLREIGALKLSPKEYLDHEIRLAERKGSGWEEAFRGDLAALQSVNDDFARIKSLQAQIGASVGVQQSMQSLNEHLNLLAGQNAQLVGLIASRQALLASQAKADNDADAANTDYQLQRAERERVLVKELREEFRRAEKADGWGIMR
jgi:type IV secretion system protein TrbJ